MSSTQERIKKRREYLKQKGKAYFEVSLAILLAMPFLVFVVMLASFVGKFIQASILAIMLGSPIFFFFRLAYESHRKAKQLPYFPPVTADTLPAEEVLVRGSEEPAQEQGKVLLRCTDGSTGIGEQELLRSSRGQNTG